MRYLKGKRIRRLIGLLAMCAAAVLALSGCGKAPDPVSDATPVPMHTVDPSLTGDMRRLEEKLIAGASNALRLEINVLQENSGAASARVPDQIINQFLDALKDQDAWTHENGQYKLTASSSGNYVYEKPYSELISGSSTDVYKIEDETGWVEEVVDNTRYDPFTWVMSGEGGGEFAFMSVYQIAEDAGTGSIETVSRLNGSVSGWSYDEYLVTDGHYRFIDLQLTPEEDRRISELPSDSDVSGEDVPVYRWVLCVGDITADSARIEEFELETGALAMPREGISLSSADTLFQNADRLGRRLTLLTSDKGRISYIEY